jgi:c-di-GMP-binding flagellar brake protein YcgR
MDRRKHPRIPYGAWIEDLTREGSIQFFLAKDLSLGGILLEAAAPAPDVGHMVHLRLVVENESRVMAVDGQVVRHAPPQDGRTAFAVRFMNLDDARQAFIDEIIKECAQAGAVTGEIDITSESEPDPF